MELVSVAALLLLFWFFASLYYMYFFKQRNEQLEGLIVAKEHRIKELEDDVEDLKDPTGSKRKQALDDVSRLEKHVEDTLAGDRRELMQRRHWQMLVGEARENREDRDAAKRAVSELSAEKKKLEDMISGSRQRYHRGEIDEESFSEITRDLQKRLIELDTDLADISPPANED